MDDQIGGGLPEVFFGMYDYLFFCRLFR